MHCQTAGFCWRCTLPLSSSSCRWKVASTGGYTNACSFAVILVCTSASCAISRSISASEISWGIEQLLNPASGFCSQVLLTEECHTLKFEHHQTEELSRFYKLPLLQQVCQPVPHHMLSPLSSSWSSFGSLRHCLHLSHSTHTLLGLHVCAGRTCDTS